MAQLAGMAHLNVARHDHAEGAVVIVGPGVTWSNRILDAWCQAECGVSHWCDAAAVLRRQRLGGGGTGPLVERHGEAVAPRRRSCGLRACYEAEQQHYCCCQQRRRRRPRPQPMLPMPDAGPACTLGTTAAFRLAAAAVCPAAVMGLHAGLPLRPPENALATYQRSVADRQLTCLRTTEMIERLTFRLTDGACIEQGVMVAKSRYVVIFDVYGLRSQ